MQNAVPKLKALPTFLLGKTVSFQPLSSPQQKSQCLQPRHLAKKKLLHHTRMIASASCSDNDKAAKRQHTLGTRYDLSTGAAGLNVSMVALT